MNSFDSLFVETQCFTGVQCTASLWNQSYTQCIVKCGTSGCIYPCANIDCGYNFGLCPSTAFLAGCDKLVASVVPQCLECLHGYFNAFGLCYSGGCPHKFVSHRLLPYICVPAPYSSSPTSPEVLFVSGSARKEVANGSLERPFYSISQAFASVYGNHSVIYLLEGSHDLNLTHPSGFMMSFKYLRRLQEFALPSLNSSMRYNVTVKPFFCSIANVSMCATRPPTLVFHNLSPMSLIVKNANMRVEDVIFEGGTTLVPGCFTEECTYCQYSTTDPVTGVVRDQRGQVRTPGTFAPLANCNSFQPYSVIGISSLASSTFVNVTFQNFRQGLNSIITSNLGSFLIFTNVNFSKLIFNQHNIGTGVITQYQSSNYSWLPRFLQYKTGYFLYYGGIVEYLNFGIEYRPDIPLAGFMIGYFYGTILMKNVTFKRNSLGVLKENLNSPSDIQGSLIYLENPLHVIIDNCIFEFNYGLAGSILRVNSNSIIWNIIVDSTDMAPFVEMTHFSIRNCAFRNNSAVDSLISFSFGADLQNIEIEECTFENSMALQGSFISFQKTQLPSILERFGGFVTLNNSQSLRYHVPYPPNRLLISNCFFVYLFYRTSLLSFTNLTNIDIRSLNISKSGDIVNENLFTTTFGALEQLGYISQTGFAMAGSSPCLSGLLFNECFNSSLANLEIENMTCELGSAALRVNNAKSGFFITDVRLMGNRTKRMSMNWVVIRNSERVFLSHIHVSNIKCGQSPIRIDFSTVIFRQCTFDGNNGDLGGAIYIPALLNQTFHECYFTNNTALEGGAIYAVSNNDTKSYLNIYVVQFVSNAAKGRGGVLEISFSEMNKLTSLTILNATLLRNSGDGVVHLQEGLLLNCKIIESIFIENDGLLSSPLNILFESGTISIENSLFEDNIGLIASAIQYVHYGSKLHENRTVNISSVVFQKHKGKPVIYVSALQSTLITSNVSFVENIVQIMNLALAVWQDRNSQFANNYDFNSIIQIHKKSNTSLFQTKFTENESYMSGSCISVDAMSSVICTECTFINNTSQKYGGAVIIRQNSYVFFNSSVFLKNNANLDGAALYFLGTNAESAIYNCTFEENSSNGGLISLLSSLLTISNSKIRKNTSALASPGITLNLSNLTLISTEFVNQKGSLGLFIALLGNSYANVTMCLFSIAQGGVTGSAIAVLSSSLSITASHFSKIQIGNVIYIYNHSNVTISYCSFAEIRKGGKSIVFGYDSKIEVQSSLFSDYNTSAVAGEKSEVDVISSNFRRGSNNVGAGLWCTSCSTVNISYSVFEAMTAMQGGAMFFTSVNQSHIEISESSFRANSAEDSGTIYAENVNLTLRSNVLSDGLSSSKTLGRGGALTLVCSLNANCLFTVISNRFRNNKAQLKGGAIFWAASMPKLVTNSFEGNSAIYGDDIASFPARLIQIPDSHNVTNAHLENISSGQISGKTLQFALVDHQGIIVTIDSLSHATMIPANLTQGAVKGKTQTQANNGVFTFSNFIISAVPGSGFNISVICNSIKSEEANTVKISVSLRKCEAGEMEDHNECIVCPSGTYSFGSKESCKQCPPEALCYGNYSIVPRAGYWRASNISEVFLKCFNQKSCLEGNPSNWSETSNCADGYESHLCQLCSNGYYYAAANVCLQCPSKWINYLKTSIVCVIYLFALLLMVKSSLRSAARPASTLSIYLKITMNYFQVIMLISSLELSWPETLKNTFIVHQYIGGPSESLFTFNCLLEITVSAGYYYKLVSVSILPVGISVIVALFWLIISCLKANFVYMSHQLVASIIIVFFLSQPSIMKTSFSAFSCIEIDGSFWLKEIMSEKCWSGTHLKYTLTAALPSIIVWCIALPAVCLSFMIRIRSRLSEPHYSLLFGFLFKGFKLEKFYWEFMILGRKILIVIIFTFVRILSSSLQALTILLLLCIDILLQDTHVPFVTDELNRAEKFSTFVCASTLFIGLIFIMEPLTTPLQIFLFVMILILNVSVLVWLAIGPLRLGIAAFRTFALKHFSSHASSDQLYNFSEDLVVPDPSFFSFSVEQSSQPNLEQIK